MISSSTTTEKLLSFYQEISESILAIEDEFSELEGKENLFLNQLDNDFSYLLWLSKLTAYIYKIESCRLDETKQLFELIENNGEQVIFALAQITASQAIRQPFYEIVKGFYQKQGVEAFKKVIGQSTDQALAKLRASLAVADLNRKVGAWWLKISFGGLTNRLDTRALQLGLPLRLLSSHLAEANKFKAEIELLPSAVDAAKNEMLKDINSKIKQINRQFERVNRLDWKTLYNKQQNLTQKRLDSIHLYVSGCKDSIDDYLKASKQVTNSDTFHIAEASYLQTVYSCTRARR